MTVNVAMTFFSRSRRKSQRPFYFLKISITLTFLLILGISWKLHVAHKGELREAGPNEETRAQSTTHGSSQLPDEQGENNVTSLIPRDLRGECEILIRKEQHRLSLMQDGVEIASYTIAVGMKKGNKEREGDMKTPEGEFVVQQIQDASAWTHDFKDGKGATAGAYGPFFIRLETTPWTGIGIHGTHDPTSIGKDITEGCIRLNNDDLLSVKNNVRIGTRVIIQ